MRSHSAANDKYLFPEEVILATANFLVAQDWEVPIRGFYIISAVRPRRSIAEFTDAEVIELARLQRLIRACLETIFGISEVYFFQNEDSEHGFHVWMFPRHPWMDQFGRKIQSVRPIMEYAVKHADASTILDIRRENSRMRRYLKHLPVEDYLSRDLLNLEQDSI